MDRTRLKLLPRRLKAGGLITETEYQLLADLPCTLLKIEIFDLLANKSLENAINMLTMIRSTEQEFETSDLVPNDPQINKIAQTMQIDMIIKCIYGFLSLKDIKNCRFVNQKWNAVAEPLLRKRSEIRLHSDGRTFEEFTEDFSSSTSSLPFTTFRLDGENWKASELARFYETNMRHIKELTMDNILIKTDIGTKVDVANIPFLPDSPITKLDLSCSKYSTFLEVSFPRLKELKDVALYGCFADVSKSSFRIQPTKVFVKNLTITQNGTVFEDYCLNDLIDFSKARDIDVSVDDMLEHLDAVTNLTLDLAECCLQIENLEADGPRMKLVNWSTSKSKINKLSMNNEDYLEKTQMSIKELHIWAWGESISVDLCALPTSVEALYIVEVDEENVFCDEPLILPQLTFLKLENPSTQPHLLRYFTNCVNLIEIHFFQSGTSAIHILNLDLLPRGLKTLKINGNETIKGEFSLDTLILYDCPLKNVYNVLRSITPSVLVLFWSRHGENNDDMITLSKFRSLPSFVGLFLWDEFPFETSKLANCVNKLAKCYCFENQMGEAVEVSEFCKLARISDESILET